MFYVLHWQPKKSLGNRYFFSGKQIFSTSWRSWTRVSRILTSQFDKMSQPSSIMATRSDALLLPSGFPSSLATRNVFHKAQAVVYKDVRPDVPKIRSTFDVSMLHSTVFINTEAQMTIKLPQFIVPINLFVKSGAVNILNYGIVAENSTFVLPPNSMTVSMTPLCKSTIVIVPSLSVSELKTFYDRLRSIQLQCKIPLSKFNWTKFVRGLRTTWACIYEERKHTMSKEDVQSVMSLLFSTELDKFPDNVFVEIVQEEASGKGKQQEAQAIPPSKKKRKAMAHDEIMRTRTTPRKKKWPAQWRRYCSLIQRRGTSRTRRF